MRLGNSSVSLAVSLFQGMFDKNILTFNPGWDRNANPLADFDDLTQGIRGYIANVVTADLDDDSFQRL